MIQVKSRKIDIESSAQEAVLLPQTDVLAFLRDDVLSSRSASGNVAVAITPKVRRALVLLLSDSLMVLMSILAGFICAALTRAMLLDEYEPLDVVPWVQVGFMFVVAAVLTHWCSWSWGHYTRFRPVWTEFRDIVKMTLYVGAACILVLFALKEDFSRLWVGFLALSMFVLFPMGRMIARSVMIKRGWWFKSTYVVGTGENAVMTAAALASDPAMGHRVDGFITLDGIDFVAPTLSGKPVITNFPDDSVTINGNERPCIVFAFDSLREMDKHRAVVNRYTAASPYTTISPPIRGLPLYGAEILTVFRQDAVLLKLQNNISKWQARFVKRGFDIVVSLMMLVVLLPVMVCVAWLVRRDGHSSMYGHKRLGRGGNTFSCSKFRSMVMNGDAVLEEHLKNNPNAALEWEATRKLSDDPRVTSIGNFLRKTSLDELPQLINVLKGEMSLVGPRPIVQQEVCHYGDHFPYYLTMTPGITGLWQTSGRSDTTYEERVSLDVWYARNWSLWHDLVILLRTVPALLMKEGAR